MSQESEHIRERFVEAAGHLTQSLGIGRVLGQIYAHCYFSREPQSLDDLTQVLGISKGSASMSVRQLEQWGAVRRIWIKGDRKDYYEALTHLGRILRKATADLVGRNMEVADALLEDASQELGSKARNGRSSDPDLEFVRARVQRFQMFREKARKVWGSPLLTMFLK
jgi:DNA-binding transcriptional regulator GbsR (MarR family)